MEAALTVDNSRSKPAAPRSSQNSPSADSSSPSPSQSLIRARHTLLTTQTADPRSPFIYGGTNRHRGSISPSSSPSLFCPAHLLPRPYPALLSLPLDSLSRLAQRARVGCSTRPLKPSKPAKLWRSHVRLLAEQRLADDEAEELVKELELAMKEGDLEGIDLLMRQIDELANGICKQKPETSTLVRREKEEEEEEDKEKRDAGREAPRPPNSMVDFVRRLRSEEDGEHEE